MTDVQPCPDDELLISYVEASVSEPERSMVESHLDTCDRCMETVRCVHVRLRATADELEPPPHALSARVRAGTAPSLTGERRRVPLLLRLPILIPMSLAAGALLVVATHTWLEPPPSRVLIRAVQMQRTTQAAAVHAQPFGQAPVVASLNGGEMVEIHAEQAGWYRVALPDGREGWIEARSFE